MSKTEIIPKALLPAEFRKIFAKYFLGYPEFLKLKREELKVCSKGLCRSNFTQPWSS